MKVSFFLFASATVSLGEAFVAKPAFQGRQTHDIVLGATVVQETSPMERSIECAETMGECSIDELVELEEQLAMINDECFIELHENDLCDDDTMAGREVLKKTLALQHELHQLEQQLKGMPFVVDTRRNQAKATKEADDHWITHYVESYHW
uniref:Uncharacterized protein n=1 Tax=Pseudictyota dubia TaxID=2749911 RepID=A0A7R9W3S8_9STRA|mmetsp:Transcript_32618/g.59987  ORF Transcript_32618/g.59987 Transcript_32618/m.59987 type:complete len:151 (+) Transcript_32618:229-681(+)